MLLTLWAKLDSSQASVVDAMYLRQMQPRSKRNYKSKKFKHNEFRYFKYFIYR